MLPAALCSAVASRMSRLLENLVSTGSVAGTLARNCSSSPGWIPGMGDTLPYSKTAMLSIKYLFSTKTHTTSGSATTMAQEDSTPSPHMCAHTQPHIADAIAARPSALQSAEACVTSGCSRSTLSRVPGQQGPSTPDLNSYSTALAIAVTTCVPYNTKITVRRHFSTSQHTPPWPAIRSGGACVPAAALKKNHSATRTPCEPFQHWAPQQQLPGSRTAAAPSLLTG